MVRIIPRQLFLQVKRQNQEYGRLIIISEDRVWRLAMMVMKRMNTLNCGYMQGKLKTQYQRIFQNLRSHYVNII